MSERRRFLRWRHGRTPVTSMKTMVENHPMSKAPACCYRTHIVKKRSAKKRHENGDGEIKEFGCPELGHSNVMKALFVGSDVQAQDACSTGSQCQVQLPWH